jgi:dienelactone hydrolase
MVIIEGLKMGKPIFILFLFICGSVFAQYPDVDKINFKERIFIFEKERVLPLIIYKNKQPAPTIIMGHSCNGPEVLHWPYVVRDWGYNVVMPESFVARGYQNICSNPRMVSFQSRAEDYDRVVEWLRDKPWHQGKIGILGFSHGAIGGMFYATENNKAKKVSAVVGYYPHCGYGGFNPNIPVQIHIGALDDWTPASLCTVLNGRGHFDIHVHPEAHHVFDSPYGVRKMYGYTVGADGPDAYNAALEKTKDFFSKNLSP